MMTPHKRSCLVLAALVTLVCAATPARAADVTGTWTASFDTQICKQNYTYTFKVTGSQLTGKAKSDNGESEIKNGKVDGDKVSFVETLMFQGMTLEITYTGTVVSNDEIKFTRDVAGLANEELVAKRTK